MQSTENSDNRQTTINGEPALQPPSHSARRVSWRSIVVGSILVCIVCGLTPFNDYVVANTFMVGSYLPLAMVLAMFFMVICINAPLHRFAPKWAFSTIELAVMLGMMLVACSVPSQGLLRTWIPTLVSSFYIGQSDGAFWKAFLALDLPAWLFPVKSIAEGRADPVVTDFYGRVAFGREIPYRAWVVPLLGWGVFIAGFFGTMFAIAFLTRRQWGVDERLPFPIAQLQLSLIEAPECGNALNALFRSPAFWIACVSVFLIQSTGPLHTYFPRYVPEIPLTFDLQGILVKEPWVHLHYGIKKATLFFTFVGVTYFIQARTTFSLWSIWLICQSLVVQQKMVQSDIPFPAWRDQHFGACLVYAAGIFWIGRKHWWRIIRHAAGARDVYKGDTGFGYRAAMYVLTGGLMAMFGWLLFVGVQAWFAVLIVGIILLAHIVTARIVAETGLPYFRAVPGVNQIVSNLPVGAMTGRDIFFGGAFSMTAGAFAGRESILPFSQHALRVNDALEHANTPKQLRSQRVWFVSALGWALALGLFVGCWSSLWSYYSFATTLTSGEPTLVNPHGVDSLPRAEIAGPLVRLSEGRFPAPVHSPTEHFAIGIGVTSLLQVLTWRYAAWPFTPVGYLVSAGPFIHLIWFSLLIGWLAKVLILRFGGASFFNAAKPFFIGLIFGEALAAGVWVVINLILAYNGVDYFPVRFLPN